MEDKIEKIVASSLLEVTKKNDEQSYLIAAGYMKMLDKIHLHLVYSVLCSSISLLCI